MDLDVLYIIRANPYWNWFGVTLILKRPTVRILNGNRIPQSFHTTGSWNSQAWSEILATEKFERTWSIINITFLFPMFFSWVKNAWLFSQLANFFWNWIWSSQGKTLDCIILSKLKIGWDVYLIWRCSVARIMLSKWLWEGTIWGPFGFIKTFLSFFVWCWALFGGQTLGFEWSCIQQPRLSQHVESGEWSKRATRA